MKARLLLLSCFVLVLICGCAHSKPHRTQQPVRPARIMTYDPATDRTTLEAGGRTWYLKGNLTNRTAAPE